jgi:hypothetical protein
MSRHNGRRRSKIIFLDKSTGLILLTSGESTMWGEDKLTFRYITSRRPYTSATRSMRSSANSRSSRTFESPMCPSHGKPFVLFKTTRGTPRGGGDRKMIKRDVMGRMVELARNTDEYYGSYSRGNSNTIPMQFLQYIPLHTFASPFSFFCLCGLCC